ncbi:WRKY transcription factor SUSIBA2-like [Vicia villosa]|uniref:WRKY transcription factor SUSIBA2-like n=1 Tax=Vicia villosa TaxID=3911 RepID=UPI00273AD5F0|nr:WRKY transcription factor SUSIBA2-like [Vicia villosa]
MNLNVTTSQKQDKNENIMNKSNSENKNGCDGIVVSDPNGETVFGFSRKKSLAERRGFNKTAPNINTNPLVSLPVRSPQFTIPPGISPTALLESPVMLPNSQAMPSPTTGSFPMLQPPMLTSITKDEGNMDISTSSHIAASSKFNSQADFTSNSLNQGSNNYQMMNGGHKVDQIFVQDQPPMDFSFSEDFSNDFFMKNSGFPLYSDLKVADMMVDNIDVPISHSEEVSDESNFLENSVPVDDIGRQHVLEVEQKETCYATGAKNSDDGYNWRKYGQKQVKGSEFPRSYYKCTQTSCQVKKKVERSHDGQITEIIYKGNHNHAKPHSNRRGSMPLNDEILEAAEANETCDRVETDSVWRNNQSRERDANHDSERKLVSQERASPPSFTTELSDPAKRARSLGVFESDEAQENSSAHVNRDGNIDESTQIVLPNEDAAEDESESKRRKKESYPTEPMMPARAIREPRVVVQIESEIDILDDGYRWRKYGQKVVKGNPNPRSYYKCTSAGCGVRKHVERASHNLKFVITTYEGKHNHEVPAAKNSHHISSNDFGSHSSGANGLHGNAGILKSETHQPLASHFDRKPDLSDEFMRSSLMGSFANDMKFGPSSISQMKYSSLDNIVPYGCTYGTNLERGVAPQVGHIPPMLPEYPMPLPLNLPSSGNFSLDGMNFNYAKPVNCVQSYLSNQQMQDFDTRFLRPKEELNDDSLYTSCPTSFDHASSSLNPPSTSPQSIYQSVMQNFPS